MRPSFLTVFAVLTFCCGTAFAETLSRGLPNNVEALDPHRAQLSSDADVLRDLFEGLVVHDAQANVIPGVATEWVVSEDGTLYTFTLREDSRWSNGDPITSEDFVYSFRRLMDPATAATVPDLFFPILNSEAVNGGELPVEELGVRAPDATTLEIELQAPTPYFLDLLTFMAALPVHRPSVEEFGNAFVRPENMVTNGAYTLVENVVNQGVVLEKSETFHAADSVDVETVEYISFEDAATCVRGFEAGEVMTCADLPPEDTKRLQAEYGDAVRITPSMRAHSIVFNLDSETLQDSEVRRALSMAIDREFLAEEIFAGTMVPNYKLVVPGVNNYPTGSPDVDYESMSLLDREDLAMEIMADRGFSTDTPVTLQLAYYERDNERSFVTAIADMWAPLGVELELIVRDLSAHYSHLAETSDYDFARVSWIADYPDPQNFLYQHLSSTIAWNYANYRNAEFDALMDQAARTSDLSKRSQLLQDAEGLLLRDLPFAPVMISAQTELVSPRIEGWEDNSLSVNPSRFIRLTDG